MLSQQQTTIYDDNMERAFEDATTFVRRSGNWNTLLDQNASKWMPIDALPADRPIKNDEIAVLLHHFVAPLVDWSARNDPF